MRIHPIPPASLGPVWQVMNIGVRPVLIRRWTTATSAEVSRRGGPLIGNRHGMLRDWSPHTVPAPIGDLFRVERDARIEFRRRRDHDRSPADRRCRRERIEGEPTPLEAVLAGFAIGLTFIMAAL